MSTEPIAHGDEHPNAFEDGRAAEQEAEHEVAPEDENEMIDVEVESAATHPDDHEGDRRAASVSSGASMFATASFAALPGHLHSLARQIRRLDAHDFLTIGEMTQRLASRELYSLLPYAGSNWYLPEIRTVGDDEPHWGFGFDPKRGVVITLAGRCLELHLGAWLLRAAALVLFWYMLYNVLGSTLMTRGGYVWDPLIVFVVSAVVGGTICRILQIPPLLGVLWIAIMWHNVPEVGYLTAGVYKEVSKIAQRVGLTVVLARAGFSLSIKSIRPHLAQSLLLSMIPYGIELTVHSLIAKELFAYDSYTWAFLQGCLCSTVSPAIIVPAVLYLQEQGYGKGNGPLSLLMSAVGIEVCLGVWASNFIIGLLFDSTPIAQAIVLGPVQIIGGIILGIIVGIGFYYLVEFIKLEAERMPNGKYSNEHLDGVMLLSFALFMFFCVGFVFFGYGNKLAGGGAVMTVFFAATVAHMWIKDGDKELVEHKLNFGRKLCATWDLVMMPALFSMVGINVNLKRIFNSTFTPKAIAILAASSGARAFVIYLIQWRSPYNWKQKLIVCGGYLGKATAQAAIGPVALTFVKARIAKEGSTPELLTLKQNAENVMDIAILYVLFMAPLAALTMTKAGPYVLPRDIVVRR